MLIYWSQTEFYRRPVSSMYLTMAMHLELACILQACIRGLHVLYQEYGSQEKTTSKCLRETVGLMVRRQFVMS